MQRVKILTGFAKGLEGTAKAYPGDTSLYVQVTITYPDGFQDLGGETDTLAYSRDELEFLVEPKGV